MQEAVKTTPSTTNEFVPQCKIDDDCPQVECGATGTAECVGIKIKCMWGKCIREEEPILFCKDSCPLDGKCYPMGYRKSEKFCSDEGMFIGQKKGDEICDNNFECKSNVCVNDKCVSQGFIEKILSWFKRLFGGGEEKPKYSCPSQKTIDCMPGPIREGSEYCEKNYRAWIEKNCDIQFTD